MKTKLYIYSQSNHLLFRTAIEAEILFAVYLIKKQALTGGKSLACEDKGSKKIGAVLVQQADRRSFEASAVLTIVYFYIIMIVHKCQQSAAQSCLRKKLSLSEIPTDKPFENRHVGCKEQEKINRRRTLCTLRINFFEATQQTACIFSKEILPVKSSLNPYRTYLV
nr:hypothetical protein [uncultured Treponema sp.]